MFRGPDGQSAANDLFCGGILQVWIFQAEQDFGMADRELAAGKQGLDVRGEVEKANGIGDGGPVFADALGDFFLFQQKFASEPGVGFGFLDGIQVFALEVFDERHVQHIAVTGGANDDGDFRQPEADAGAPPALAGISGDADWSILFFSGGASMDLKRTDLRRVKPYAERFEVKIGTIKAIDF